MAMYSVKCSDVSSCRALHYTPSDLWEDPYYDSLIAKGMIEISLNSYETKQHEVSIIRFLTPFFAGESESITLNLRVGYCSMDVTLGWAVCTSDSNWKDYIGAFTPSVADENKVCSGTLVFPEFPLDEIGAYGDYGFSFEIPVARLKSNTTYYLFFWHGEYVPAKIVGIRTDRASMYINYNSGIVYIDNGSGLVAYQGYIDNGSDWDMVVPFIDNGSGWDMYT